MRPGRREAELVADGRSELHHIATALDSGATAFTICEVADGVTLTSSAFDGVAAYHVIAGTMHLRLPCGTSYIARADTLVLVPAGVAPRISTGPEDDAVIVDGRQCLTRTGPWIVADATRGRPAALTVAAARITGTTRASLSVTAVVALGGESIGRRLSALLREEVANPGAANGALAISLMTSCIVLALRKAIDTDDTRPAAATATGNGGLIARAVNAVNSEPGAAHSVESLADTAGMSRATFVRQFARAMQMSPMQFVRQTRLTEAAAMLRSGSMPIKAVAARTGFASRSHFSREFRKTYGQDPTTFRDTVVAMLPSG